MKLYSASAHAVAAALLLAYVCVPQPSTTVDASMSDRMTQFRRWIISSLPGRTRTRASAPANAGAAGHADGTGRMPQNTERTGPQNTERTRPRRAKDSRSQKKKTKDNAWTSVQPQPEKLQLQKPIASQQNEVQISNEYSTPPGVVRYLIGLSKDHKSHVFSRDQFIKPDGKRFALDFQNDFKNQVYKQYEETAMNFCLRSVMVQSSIQLPPKLVWHHIEPVIARGPYTYKTYDDLSPNDNIVNWWVNFSGPLAFDRFDGGYEPEAIQDWEVPELAAIAMQFRTSSTPKVFHDIHQQLVHSDNVTPRPITVTNLIRHMNFKTQNTAEVFKIFQARIHVLALLAPQRNPKNAGSPYTIEQIRFIFHMAFNGFGQARKQSAYIRGSNFLDLDAIPVVNTGNWGGGEFRNSPLLMAVVQIAAAHATGVNLVAWLEPGLPEVWARALVAFGKVWSKDRPLLPTEELIRGIHALGFKWPAT